MGGVLLSEKSIDLSKIIIEAFIEDVGDTLSMLEDLEDDFESFAIVFHGIKSALANIGELDVSKDAGMLEIAAESLDLDVVSNNTPKFIQKLIGLKDKYVDMLQDTGVKKLGDINELYNLLSEVVIACDGYDDQVAKVVLDKIDNYQWEFGIQEKLKQIRSLILVHSEFEKACDVIETVYLGLKNKD